MPESIEHENETESTSPAGKFYRAYKKHHSTFLIVSILIMISSFILTPAPPQGESVSFFGYDIPNSCPSHVIWGIDCAGCGMTRSFVAIVHGQWKEALEFNRVGPILFLLVIIQIPYRLYMLTRPMNEAFRPQTIWVQLPPGIVICSLIASWILKTLGI